jgi:2,3-bisphosphoglycerate-dependent phosphoglycerate mutase
MKIAGKCGFLLILLIYSAYGFLQPSSRRGGNLLPPKSFMSETKARKTNEEEQGEATTSSSKLSSQKTLDINKIQLNDFEDLEYSRCLSPTEEKQQVLSEGEEYIDKTSIWKKVARKMIPRPGRKTKKGALILLRCGQSTFNANQTFTGWMDPPLSDQGIEQCKHAASLFVAEGFEPDVVYTSRLKRAIVSAWTVLETMDSLFIPVFKTYRLNQRMYGALQGLSKRETAKEFGPEVVQAWRNSLKARPPHLAREDPNHPSHDRRYADLSEDLIPTSESILDCMERARPLWEYKIRKDIERGKTVLVVAHRDTLRGLAKVIDGLSDEDVTDITIPSGMPIVYKFDQDMKVVEPADPSLSQIHTSGTFLEKPGRLKEAFEKHSKWSDLLVIEGGAKKRMSTLEKSLERLRHVEEGLGGAIRKATVIISNDEEETVKLKADESPIAPTERWNDDPSEFEEYYDFFTAATEEEDFLLNIMPSPLDKTSNDPPPEQEGPFVVLIRHGRTPHNNMGLFTGW